MESDLLGMISNVHMQLADQRDDGTFNADCTKLAAMASTAVDFSKTGIAVNMKDCPKYPRCRPDFMAPSPRIIVSEKGSLDFEEEDDDEDLAFIGLDAERRSFRFYESPKVLGQLHRAIDEKRFLTRMQQDRQASTQVRPARSLLGTLLAYMKRMVSQYGVLYIHHEGLGADIQAG